MAREGFSHSRIHKFIWEDTHARRLSFASSPADQKKSSINALRHGFTGQSAMVSSEEKPLYDAHVIAYLEHYQPKTHEESNLTQQYADQHWTLHQTSIQQMNVLTMLNMSNARHMKIGSDFETLNKTAAPFYKQIGTLGIYERRRRQAAQETPAQFNELKAAREKAFAEALTACKALKPRNQPFNPADSGFFRKYFLRSFTFNELQWSIRAGEIAAGTSSFHFRG